MSINWQAAWATHPDVFIAREWQECPAEKRKSWRLPAQFSYFWGGDTALRVGIIASSIIPREDDFLLAGVQLGNRLSNGAKTVVYFVAPDFSPYFLHAIAKIGENISGRAVYWRERLNPSLYLIPEGIRSGSAGHLGEMRADWIHWGQGLNPVSRQDLEVVRSFFARFRDQGVRWELKPQVISFLWGNLEIAELRRRGKKFELMAKAKWEKDHEKALQWQKPGWIDSSGVLNPEFQTLIEGMLQHLNEVEQMGELRSADLLALKLWRGGGVWNSLWGTPLQWPWLPKERCEIWISDLNNWFYFQANGQISVVCPVLERPLAEGGKSILLASVLEKDMLLKTAKCGENSDWDGIIHWLTLSEWEDDLRRWHSWLKAPEQFKIWVLPDTWKTQDVVELSSRSDMDFSLKPIAIL